MGICLDNIDWRLMADTGAVLAGAGAALAAIFAAYQICVDRSWRKRDRTFSHSPYRNEEFLTALRELEKKYPFFAKRNSKEQVTRKVGKDIVPHLVIAANFWGQMATEYKIGLLDKKLARNLLRWKFKKFCHVFNDWLKREGRDLIYEDTLELFKEWDKE